MTKIKNFTALLNSLNKERESGRSVVFVHGFFDILHKGHVDLLIKAKKLGDILVVGVDHDDNARIIKGPKRPIHTHKARMYVISAISCVDYVFLIPSYAHNKDSFGVEYDSLYKKIKPNIVASSIKAGKHGLIKKKIAEQMGAKFVDI